MHGLSSFSRRGVVLLTAAVLVVTAAAGCDAGAPPAAVVNGHEISASRLEEFSKTLAATLPAGPQAASLRGEGEGTWTTDFSASLLSYLVSHQIVLDAAEARGVTITAADRTQGKTTVAQDFSSGAADGSTTDDGTATFAKLPKDLQTFLTEATAAQIALQADLGKGVSQEAAARKAFDANPATYQQVCLSTITVATPAILTLVQNRLKSGESFAAVAKDASIDNYKAEGGLNPCTPINSFAADIAQEFATGGPTDVKGPFQTSGGESVLVVVTERKPSTFAEVKDAIVQALPAPGEAQLTAFLTKAEKQAKVKINPRFGRWSAANHTVVPPKAPAAPKTTTTTAPKS